MKKLFVAAALAATMVSPVVMPGVALAQDYHWHGDQGRGWDPSHSYHAGNYDRRMTRNDRVYRGSDGRYYCRRNDGTTGLVIGALGGGVLGSAVGGGVLGTLVGAGAGGLLGRSIDRGNVHCR
jgi:hypothetical protein